jgi:hypothetical protein
MTYETHNSYCKNYRKIHIGSFSSIRYGFLLFICEYSINHVECICVSFNAKLERNVDISVDGKGTRACQPEAKVQNDAESTNAEAIVGSNPTIDSESFSHRRNGFRHRRRNGSFVSLSYNLILHYLRSKSWR